MSGSKKCCRKGCENEARYAIMILVPPQGFPAHERNCVKVIVDLHVCLAHATPEPLELMPNLEIYAEAMRHSVQSEVPVNVKCAWTKPLRFDSYDYIEFDRVRRKSQERDNGRDGKVK